MSATPLTYGTWDLPTAARHVEEGLPASILTVVQERLGLSDRALADLLLVSPRTLTRRRTEARLPPDESERALRVARLSETAVRVLGSETEARAWMREPNFTLGDQTPLALARTGPGVELVERTLVAAEHGLSV